MSQKWVCLPYCLYDVMGLSALQLSRLCMQPGFNFLDVLQCIIKLRSQVVCLGLQVLASPLIALQVSKSMLDLSIQLLDLHRVPHVTSQVDS